MDRDVFEILRCYPQIYLACHVEHRTRASSPSGLTERDSSLLAHVDESGTSPAVLARHLGVAPSTLSAALARLEGRGLLSIDADGSDGRRRRVTLTPAGRDAIASHSVLDPDRLSTMMAAMSGPDRQQAVRGLQALAAAARRYREGEA